MLEIKLGQLKDLLKDVKEDIRNKEKEINENLIQVTHKVDNEIIIDVVKPEKDVNLCVKELEDLYDREAYLKNIQDLKNLETKAGEYTLAEAIVKAKSLRMLLKYYDTKLINVKSNTTERKNDGYNSNTSYYEIKTSKLDKENIIAQRKSINEKLMNLESLIDYCNANTIIKIEK